MNCKTHPSRPSVYNCESCGAPICESCYDVFELPDTHEHVCSDCFKEEVRKEIGEVNALKSMVKREFIFIVIGLVIGLAAGLYFLISWIHTDLKYAAIPLMVFLPFIFGSLMTIIKKIKNQYMDSRDTGGDASALGANIFILILTIVLNLVLSPITTLVRFFQRIGDMRQLNTIMQNDERLIVAIDQYIAESLQPSMVEASANGTAGDVELSLDAILAAGGGSEAALCDNGEILRTVRRR